MSELSAVQLPMWNYADEVGWAKISPEEAIALRGDISGLFFTETLVERLIALNSAFMTPELAQEVLRRLRLAHPSIQGNRELMRWMRGEMSIFVPAESRERNVRLIDFENVANNRFHSTIEWRHKATVYTNRADVVFLINGMPVAIAEAKNAGKPDGLGEGIEQLRRYHRETPEMLVAPQVFEVTQLLDFYYGATWATSRKNVFNWKDEQDGDFETKVKGFFEPTRFLRVLRDYIVFLEKDDQLSKLILRQHQTRAVEKAVERAREPHKQRGASLAHPGVRKDPDDDHDRGPPPSRTRQGKAHRDHAGRSERARIPALFECQCLRNRLGPGHTKQGSSTAITARRLPGPHRHDDPQV